MRLIVPRYSISFDSIGFSVATEHELQLGYEATFGATKVAGAGNMAVQVETSSAAFTRRLGVFGKSGNEVPRPAGSPMPVWTGTDTPLATVTVTPDGWSVVVVPGATPGAFTVRASVPDVPWGAEVAMDVTLVQEAPDHLAIV